MCLNFKNLMWKKNANEMKNEFFFRYNITTGKYPFEGDNIYKLFENIGRGDFTIPEELEENICSLLKGMLHKDPDLRFTLQQVKNHRYAIHFDIN